MLFSIADEFCCDRFTIFTRRLIGCFSPSHVFSTFSILCQCRSIPPDSRPLSMTEKLEQMEVDPRSDGANVNVVAPDDTNGVQGGNTELSVQSAAARDQEPESSPTSQGTVTGKREECNSNDTYKSIDQSMMIELNSQSSGRTTRDGCVGTSDQEKVMPCEDRKRIPQSPLGDENLSKKIKESSPSRDYDIPAALSSNSQPTSDEINASYENMEPAIAEIIRDKLEDIVDIVPLKPLSLRDLAELENSLQIGDKYDYSPDDGWKKDWSGNLQLFEKVCCRNNGSVRVYQLFDLT